MPSAAYDRRTGRLRDAATPTENYVRLAICTACGHRDALPFDRLLRRFGPDHPIADALSVLKCSACGQAGAVRFQLTRICDGECGAPLR